MNRILFRAALVAAALLVCLCKPTTAHAQTTMHWGFDASRAARPGAYVPYDGAPYSHRYAYPETPMFLWGSYGRAWQTQYELDRLERFETFGTRYGPDHPPLFNRLLDRWRK